MPLTDDNTTPSATVEWYGPDTWDCSCGEDSQDLPSVWGDGEVQCSSCGALFNFSLDGDTESGFYLSDPEAVSQ